MFRIGQRIVCINDAPNPAKRRATYHGLRMPVAGQVYTIRGFAEPDSIWLEEIVNPVMTWSTGTHEASFWTVRFRPVVDLGWAHRIVAEVMNKQPARAA
jgi:hypothetical protein